MSESWSEFIRDLSHYRYEINGQPTDFIRLSKYLTEVIKSQYAINEVPVNIVNALKDLNDCLSIAEDTYEQTIDLIITEIKKQRFPELCAPKLFEE